MKDIVIGGNGDQISLVDAVEGLAYLSVDFDTKELLANDATFLSRLFALLPHQKDRDRIETNSALFYGIVIIILNLCAYPPRLTEEETQIEKLKRMAKAGKNSNEHSGFGPLDDDNHVKNRGRKLVAAGAPTFLASIVRGTASHGIMSNVGKAFLSLVENKENRGKVLQCGGAKALMLIINKSTSRLASEPSSTKSPLLETSDLQAVQALARLSITSSPIQVFGPNEGAAFDAIRPLSLMVVHPSSSLLQCFEGIMALTNLASLGPQCAARIVKMDGLMNKVELMLLDDHVLIRRASMELICNLLAGSEELFERYGGGQESNVATSKMQILLAMSDVEDIPTRLAASGALATLTTEPTACSTLFKLHLERHRVLPILTSLIDSSSSTDHEGARGGDAAKHGLVHRGVVCIRNLLVCKEALQVQEEMSAEAERVGLLRAVINLVKEGKSDASVLKPTAEILAYLKPKEKA
jgi:hypothetical protein